MTIIRQWAVTNSTLGNMRRLMNEDERILIRGEQFLPSIIGSPVSCVNGIPLWRLPVRALVMTSHRAVSVIRRPA